MRKFVIDCDVGTDDAQAICMALAQPDIQLLAVTTVFGNASLECTSYNALRVLHMVGRTDIPVYAGCSSQLLSNAKYVSDDFMGSDGLGDTKHFLNADKSLIKKQHSCLALIELANQYKGELELIVTGPLTNIAVALKLDPDFGKKLKACYVMGGNTKGRGNKTITAEFNIYSDPEATHTVLEGLGCDITLVPIEICAEASFSWEWYEKFINTPGKTAEFIRDAEVSMNARAKASGQEKYIAIWDQLAMAVAIDNSVAMETKRYYVAVELAQSLTRGQCVVDWDARTEKKANVSIPTKINQEKFEKLLYDGIRFGV